MTGGSTRRTDKLVSELVFLVFPKPSIILGSILPEWYGWKTANWFFLAPFTLQCQKYQEKPIR